MGQNARGAGFELRVAPGAGGGVTGAVGGMASALVSPAERPLVASTPPIKGLLAGRACEAEG